MSRRLVALLVIMSAATWGVLLWTRAHAPPSVPRATAAIASGPAGVGALGRVEPATRIRRLSQPGGFSVNRVGRLMVREGDTVTEGTVLAVLADAEQKDAAVAQAVSAIAEASAQLEKIRAAARPSELEAQKARIAALSAVEDMALRDAARAEQLAASGAGARAAAERNRAIAARATADRAEAVAQLVTLTHPRPEDVVLAEAKLRGAEAALRKAQADAELSSIRAPIEGTILKIHAHTGDQIGADGLLEMADLERLDVVADVYETDLPRLRMGADAQVIVPGEPHRYKATVREIGWLVRRDVQANADPVAAVDARTVEVRLTLDNAGRAALRRRTNMQVQVAIQP